MDLQDPKVQRLLIAVILSAGVLYGYFGTSLAPFTYPSRGVKIQELKTQQEQLTRDLERARLTIGNAAKLEREFDYLHRQWMVAQRLIPDEREVSGLVRKISAAGTQAGLEWVRFEPKPSMVQGFYQENPIEVELEGGFHQVGTFLGSLANLGRIMNVRALKIEGVDPRAQAEDDNDHSLTATMEVVAYTMDKAGMNMPIDASDASQSLSAADLPSDAALRAYVAQASVANKEDAR
jgi:Tfp pilus assembly protein PilO